MSLRLLVGTFGLALVVCTWVYASTLPESPIRDGQARVRIIYPAVMASPAELPLSGESCTDGNCTASTPDRSGPPAKTRLRCYYRISSDAFRLGMDYVLAVAKDTNDPYELPGHWLEGRQYHWQSVFVPDAQPAQLQSMCQDALIRQGIYKPVEAYTVGDAVFSFDYPVWHNVAARNPFGIDSIVAFGDSLSDTHNLYNASRHTIPNKSSWFAGRFTNGHNWVEYLAGDLRVPLSDWAVGGTGVEDRKVFPWASVPGLVSQVSDWQATMRKGGQFDPNHTLFTVLVGGNDLVYFHTPVATILAEEERALESLISGGARHILLLNLPDVSRAPLFQLRGDADVAAEQVKAVNQGLAQLVNSIKQLYGAQLDIQLFDTHALFENIVDQPQQYGFSNVSDSCLNIESLGMTSFVDSHSPRIGCRDPGQYLFWDMLHPTTKAHRLLATGVLQQFRTHIGAEGEPDTCLKVHQADNAGRS